MFLDDRAVFGELRQVFPGEARRVRFCLVQLLPDQPAAALARYAAFLVDDPLLQHLVTPLAGDEEEIAGRPTAGNLNAEAPG